MTRKNVVQRAKQATLTKKKTQKQNNLKKEKKFIQKQTNERPILHSVSAVSTICLGILCAVQHSSHTHVLCVCTAAGVVHKVNSKTGILLMTVHAFGAMQQPQTPGKRPWLPELSYRCH